MRILSYSPSVEVYVEHDGAYMDLTQDVTSCSVTRRVDAASEFSLSLQNRSGKYNGAFSPMDRVAIYATKTERHRILTGYVKSADAFTLYPSEFKMSGRCTLYRLQALYWDPALLASQNLLFINPYDGGGGFDGGYWATTANLLTKVGGWSADAIRIQESIPDDVVEMARSLYEASQSEAGQIMSMADEFQQMLRTSGPMLSGGQDSSGQSSGQYDEGDASPTQRKIAEIAEHADRYGIPCTPDYCAMFVSMVYQEAGRPYPGGNAIDFWNNWKSSGSTSMEGIPVGAVVCGSGVGQMGAIYGHVGVYIGGGKVANNIGSLSIETLDQWCAWQTANCQGHVGWIGWVWPNNEDLSRL